MRLHVWGFAKQPWKTVAGSVLALTVEPLTWKRLMSRGFPAFFRQFWLHFRKNFRKNLSMGQRETNESGPATWSSIWVTSGHKSDNKRDRHTISSFFTFIFLNEKCRFLCNDTLMIVKKRCHLVNLSLSYCHRLPWTHQGRLDSTPPHRPTHSFSSCRAWRRLRCSYSAAQCCHSSLSQSQCERPHQQHLPCIIKRLRWQVWLPTSIVDEGGREGGRSRGRRSKEGSVEVLALVLGEWVATGGLESRKMGGW